MTRALAVVAVRLGLRAQLSAASRPVRPKARMGNESSLENTRASSGPPTTRAVNMKSVPPPSSTLGSAPTLAPSSTPTAAARTAPPSTSRTLEVPDRSNAEDRMASTGLVRPARNAGTATDATVTRVPTTSPMTTVPVVTFTPAPGSGTSNAESTAWSPTESAAPATRPTALATSPTSSPSVMSERRTCPGVPPTARTRASSRNRWVTTTEKVLKITNAHTNSDRNANPVRTGRSTSTNVLSSCCSRRTTPSPVTTWASGGSACSRDCCTCAGSPSVRTRISDQLTRPPPRTSAASFSKNDTVPPASTAADRPNDEMPTTFAVRSPSGVSRTTLLPVRRPALPAVARSTTTSPPAVGARPESSVSGLSPSSTIHGRPWVRRLTASPSGLSTRTDAVVTGAAAATPGTPRTRASESGPRGLTDAPASPRSARSPAAVTARSTPAYCCSTLPRSETRTASVSMRPAARNATPTTTAAAVARNRVQLARRLERASRSTSCR